MADCLCCSGEDCCRVLCGLCVRGFSTAHYQHIRIGYLVLTGVTIALGVDFMYTGFAYLSYLPGIAFGTCYIRVVWTSCR